MYTLHLLDQFCKHAGIEHNTGLTIYPDDYNDLIVIVRLPENGDFKSVIQKDNRLAVYNTRLVRNIVRRQNLTALTHYEVQQEAPPAYRLRRIYSENHSDQATQEHAKPIHITQLPLIRLEDSRLFISHEAIKHMGLQSGMGVSYLTDKTHEPFLRITSSSNIAPCNRRGYEEIKCHHLHDYLNLWCNPDSERRQVYCIGEQLLGLDGQPLWEFNNITKKARYNYVYA